MSLGHVPSPINYPFSFHRKNYLGAARTENAENAAFPPCGMAGVPLGMKGIFFVHSKFLLMT